MKIVPSKITLRETWIGITVGVLYGTLSYITSIFILAGWSSFPMTVISVSSYLVRRAFFYLGIEGYLITFISACVFYAVFGIMLTRIISGSYNYLNRNIINKQNSFGDKKHIKIGLFKITTKDIWIGVMIGLVYAVLLAQTIFWVLTGPVSFPIKVIDTSFYLVRMAFCYLGIKEPIVTFISACVFYSILGIILIKIISYLYNCLRRTKNSVITH